jgi:hypothetical protein
MAPAMAAFVRRQVTRPFHYVSARVQHEYNETALQVETLLWQAKVRTTSGPHLLVGQTY